MFLPRNMRPPRIEVQVPLPLVNGPGKLPRQELTSCRSCPEPLRRQFFFVFAFVFTVTFALAIVYTIDLHIYVMWRPPLHL